MAATNFRRVDSILKFRVFFFVHPLNGCYIFRLLNEAQTINRRQLRVNGNITN